MAGIDYVLHQAAIPSVPRSVEDPITSNRANVDATLNVLVAARDAKVKRSGLRRLLVRLRRYADAAQARGHADQAALPVRAAEAGWRTIHAAVHHSLRSGDGDDSLFQRLRTASGPFVALLGRNFGVHDARCWTTARRRSTATESRRAISRTSPTSLTASCGLPRRMSLGWC